MNSTAEKYAGAVDEYLRRTAFRNVSPQTLTNYERTLRRFGDFLARQAEPIDLFAVVEAWRDDLTTGGAMPSTVKQYLTELSIFFGRASKRSFPAPLRFPENPVDADLAPKVPKKPYNNLLDDCDIIKLWQNSPNARNTGRTWARNFALVVLILGTGLRNKEVLDLALSDVDFQHAEITVRAGKGNKYRIVDAPKIVLAALEQYLDSGLRPAHLSDDDFLFGTRADHTFGDAAAKNRRDEKWHRGTTAWLSQLIERHVRNVCGVSDIRSHDLRHIFARLQLNASGNISELQAALGHSSPEITQIYAGRVQPHRFRDSAREVLAARDAAAEQIMAQIEAQNRKQNKIVTLYA